MLKYLSPYRRAFAPALILQQTVGITPSTGDRPFALKNIIQVESITYGVHANSHTNIKRLTIFASVISIATYENMLCHVFVAS